MSGTELNNCLPIHLCVNSTCVLFDLLVIQSVVLYCSGLSSSSILFRYHSISSLLYKDQKILQSFCLILIHMNMLQKIWTQTSHRVLSIHYHWSFGGMILRDSRCVLWMHVQEKWIMYSANNVEICHIKRPAKYSHRSARMKGDCSGWIGVVKVPYNERGRSEAIDRK